MKISKLLFRLIKIWIKYGNCEIDLVIEEHSIGQVEMPLGELAYSSRGKRVKLLSEGFT